MTQKEAVLALMRGEKPDVIVNGYEPFQVVFDDLLFHTSPSMPNTTIVDAWGVTMVWEEGQPGTMPSEDPALLACPDVTEWKTYLTPPDVRGMELDFTGALGQKAGAHAQGKFAMGFMPCGVFELLHNILGFEEALVDLLVEPEDTKELVDAIFDYKLACLERLADGWQPDGVLMHDDFGSKDSLLMPPDTWREFFKEGYRKLFDYAHSRGMFVMLHSDSNNALIAKELEEIGVDIWQGALPQCDLAGLQAELPGKMLFMGGIDAAVVDHKDIDPEIIRAEVKRACDEYLPGGKFIPCLTYGMAGAIYPGVQETITATIAEMNQ